MDTQQTAVDPSATAMLKADHQRVRQLVAQFNTLAGSDAADEDQKRMLAERICQEVDIHARLEEEIFYPAVRACADIEDVMDEAEVAHRIARDLIHQIEAMSPGDPLYDAKVKVLGEYVGHHVEEEERRMMPKAKKAGIDEADLARRMAERRRQLEAEQSIQPFEALTAMLTMPIRAAVAAARAGSAARRRAASASDGRSASPSAARGVAGKVVRTTARKAAGTTARRAARPAAKAGTRGSAGAGAKAGTKSGAKAGSKAGAKAAAGGARRSRAAR